VSRERRHQADRAKNGENLFHLKRMETGR
jgi:hypothetical protein